MSDLAIIDGDQTIFQPSFGPAIVIPLPGRILGSGPPTLSGRRLCVAGDEASVQVLGCAYVTPVYSIPGVGTLRIEALAGDQQARKAKSAGKALILKGSSFQARFEIQTPAQMPPPVSTPDATPTYSGSGRFVTTNTRLRVG